MFNMKVKDVIKQLEKQNPEMDVALYKKLGKGKFLANATRVFEYNGIIIIG